MTGEWQAPPLEPALAAALFGVEGGGARGRSRRTQTPAPSPPLVSRVPRGLAPGPDVAFGALPRAALQAALSVPLSPQCGREPHLRAE